MGVFYFLDNKLPPQKAFFEEQEKWVFFTFSNTIFASGLTS